MDNKKLELTNLMADREQAAVIMQAEHVKDVLIACSWAPGAKITLTVEHELGISAVFDYYDTAAFVQGLLALMDDVQADL